MPPIILSTHRRAMIQAIIADALAPAMASDHRQTSPSAMEDFKRFVQFLVEGRIFSLEQIRTIGDLPDAALAFFPGVLTDQVTAAAFTDKQILLSRKIIGFADIVAIGGNAEQEPLAMAAEECAQKAQRQRQQAKIQELAKRQNTLEWFCYKALRSWLETRIVKLKKNRSGRDEAKALRQWLLAREKSLKENAATNPYQLYTNPEYKDELGRIIQASKSHSQGGAVFTDFANFIDSLDIIYQYKDPIEVENNFVAPTASLGEALLELLLSADRDKIEEALHILAGISPAVIKDFVKQYHQEFVRDNDFIGNKHQDVFAENVCAAMAARILLSPLSVDRSARERFTRVLHYALTPYDPRFCNGFDVPIIRITDPHPSKADIVQALTQSGSMREAMYIDKLPTRKRGEFMGRCARFYRDATDKINIHISFIGQQRKEDGEVDLCATMRKFFDSLYGNALVGQYRVPISLVVPPYSQKGMATDIYWESTGVVEAKGLSKPKRRIGQNSGQDTRTTGKFERFAKKMVSRWLVDGNTGPGEFHDEINPFHSQTQRLTHRWGWYLTDEFIEETQALISKVRNASKARLASCLATMTEFWGEAHVLNYFCNAFNGVDAVRFDSILAFQSAYLAKQEQCLQAVEHLALDLKLGQLLVRYQQDETGRNRALVGFFQANPDYRLGYITLKAATHASHGKYFIKSPVLRAILKSRLIRKVKGNLVVDTVATYLGRASQESAVSNSQTLLAKQELEILLDQYRNDKLKPKGSRDSWVIQALQRRIVNVKEMLNHDDKRKILQDIRRYHWRLDRHRASYKACAKIVNAIYGRPDDSVDLYRELMSLSAQDFAQHLEHDFSASRLEQIEHLKAESIGANSTIPPAPSLPPIKATGWTAWFFSRLQTQHAKNTPSFS